MRYILRRGRAPRTQPGQFCPGRARAVEVGALVLFAIMGSRSFYLAMTTTDNEILHSIADSQYQRHIELAPYRGTIHDRKGEPLAISVRRPSLAVNPRVFSPTTAEVERLARILKMKPQEIRKIDAKKTYFSWLARQLEQRVADEAMSLGLNGMVSISEPARFYPAGGAAAQLLGYVGIDNGGLGGLERQYDAELRGKPHKVLARRDARGQVIFDESGNAAPEKMGHSLHLTIDRVIQEIAEDELANGVKTAKAKNGFAIVSDPHTGKILAVANYPGFDPNAARKLKQELTRNHALSDVYEPGSVTKPFLVAKAIDVGATRRDEVFDCEKGAMRIGKHVIHDDHPAPFLTTEEAIIRSSNICTYKIALKLGRERTYEAYKLFGFGGGGSTSLGFPGQMQGRLGDPTKWENSRFANISFGHGFIITGLEMVQAMGAIANGGNYLRPSLVDRITASDGLVQAAQAPAPTRALSPETARMMREIMRNVVTDKHGTAKRASTPSYTVAGKTGTAQKVEEGKRGYSKDKRIASFIGFAPAQDPHLVVYVVIDEPGQKPYYGGLWAAPVFSGIVERSLKYLNVAPDMPAISPIAGSTGHEPKAARKM